MAFFDPYRRAVTIRIVYDGLGTAGKTTNVRQVHELFTLARSGEVIVPEEQKGRTLYFDWLELDAGFIGDELRLRCQLLTVPGQFAYAHRRWQILRVPDAIVEVCDSSPSGVVRSGYAMRFLRAMLAEGNCPGVPIIVQANKQDLPGALSGPALARELGLEETTRVVEAVASRGEGVRATLFFALHAARERVRALLEQEGLEALETGAESAEDVYQRMLQVEEHPEVFEGARLTDLILGADPEPPLEPLPEQSPGAFRPALEPLPRPDVPPGHVWPSPLARVLLRELAETGARPTGTQGSEELGAGGRYALLSSPSLVFADAARGGLALRELARVVEMSAELLPSPVALALQPAVRGSSCRLWMIRPRLSPLPSAHEGLTALLARACAASLALFVEHGVVVEVRPGACALEGDRLVVLGLPAHLDALDPGFVAGLARWVDGDAALARAFAPALADELRRRLSPAAPCVPDLKNLLARFAPDTPEGESIRSALLDALAG